jgi:hypothetical protein
VMGYARARSVILAGGDPAPGMGRARVFLRVSVVRSFDFHGRRPNKRQRPNPLLIKTRINSPLKTTQNIRITISNEITINTINRHAVAFV